jgi:hypothetical protein
VTGVGLVTSPRRVLSPGRRHDEEIVARPRKATGQLTGVTGMVEKGRYCPDVLDQLAADRGAVDAVAPSTQRRAPTPVGTLIGYVGSAAAGQTQASGDGGDGGSEGPGGERLPRWLKDLGLCPPDPW